MCVCACARTWSYAGYMEQTFLFSSRRSNADRCLHWSHVTGGPYLCSECVHLHWGVMVIMVCVIKHGGVKVFLCFHFLFTKHFVLITNGRSCMMFSNFSLCGFECFVEKQTKGQNQICRRSCLQNLGRLPIFFFNWFMELIFSLMQKLPTSICDS